jgi:hypothetical protein
MCNKNSKPGSKKEPGFSFTNGNHHRISKKINFGNKILALSENPLYNVHDFTIVVGRDP